MKVAIIGGGASGVLCALKLKKLNNKYDITIFEASNKLLKKVSISGNGRCNLGNLYITDECYLNKRSIQDLSTHLGDSLAFFENLGLLTYTDNEGRIYPLSKEANSVVEILNKELFYNRIKVINNTFINEIKRVDNQYLIKDDRYDYVVIATGSNAGIKLNYDPYELINNLNFKMTALKPGLVGFKVKEDLTDIAGVRASVTVSAFGKKSQGEIIFKEDGVSGICVMDLSIFKNDDAKILIDLLPDYSLDDLLNYMHKKISNDSKLKLHNLMLGTVHSKILNIINRKYHNELVNDLTDDEVIKYLKIFKSFKLTITESYDLSNAQVVCGGVSFSEVENFESKKYPNLFLVGEVLDQAGICGGYNLWFAFTTGLVVAEIINGRC